MPGSRFTNTSSVSGASCILLALMVLVLPLKWLLAAILAAAVHEGFHIAAVYLLGGQIRGLSLGSGGAVISAAPMSRGKELICVLAGPLGSLTLLLFAKWLPRTAVCALIQSVYNLLPFLDLDGGKALRCILTLFLPADKAQRVCDGVQRAVSAGMILLGIYAAVRLALGWMPLILALYISVKAGVIKIPCKKAAQGVQ